MLTLVIGDLFIPDRSLEIPHKFRKLLCPNINSVPSNSKINDVICLGNITSSLETLQFLYNLTPQFHLVKGIHDDSVLLTQYLSSLAGKETDVPEQKIISHGNFRIGFTSGSLIVPQGDPLTLLTLARELDVDILVWGATHKVEAYTLEGKFFINPGSATGAFNYDWPELLDEEKETELDLENSKGSVVPNTNENGKTNVDYTKEEGSSEPSTENASAKEKTSGENIDQKNQKTLSDENPKDETSNDKGNNECDNERSIDEIKGLTECIPSFCLLDTYDTTCVLYIYTYFNDEVKVDKVTYQKD